MEDSLSRSRSHHKKKKKHARHSSAESSSASSSSDGERERKRMKEKKKHRHAESRSEHRKRDVSPPERARHASPDRRRDSPDRKHRSPDRRRDSPERKHRSPERRHPKEDRERHHRERGSRWESESRAPEERKVKPEPDSDDEDQNRRRDDRGHAGDFESRRGRGGGRPWGRGGRGRGRGRGGRGRGGEEGEFEWGRPDNTNQPAAPKVEKEKPNFGLSGKLTEDTNTINGIVIKYSEPPESRKPKRRWRLYVFKGEETLPTLYIHRQSAYLMGRDRKVADIPLDHPSVSKQHAALQYRLVTFKRPDGLSTIKCIRPYIIDLESANGTYVNNKKIEAKKYVELMEKDVLKFGYSSREYVLLHEHSQDTNSGDDDDVQEDGPNP